MISIVYAPEACDGARLLILLVSSMCKNLFIYAILLKRFHFLQKTFRQFEMISRNHSLHTQYYYLWASYSFQN